MRVFAIADPHLSKAQPKPMDVFGQRWQGHPEVFFQGWLDTVSEEDLVLIPGDISWALKLEDALLDLNDIATLPGQKVILRGNHDYWWPSISKLRKALPKTLYAIQNDALLIQDVTIAGSRGWTCPGTYGFSAQDQKIYLRELERLKLSLAKAKKLKGRKFIVMLHYPPTNPKLEASEFTQLIEEACPDALVFGHIHSDDIVPVLPHIQKTSVHFVAADALNFKPKLILDLA